jgi:hypothetical protein
MLFGLSLSLTHSEAKSKYASLITHNIPITAFTPSSMTENTPPSPPAQDDALLYLPPRRDDD